MEPVSVKKFIDQLKLAMARFTPHLTLKIIEENPHRLKGRIKLASGRNVDVFYGSKKGRIDFALIDGNQRIWGVDNLGGWHFHPIGNEKEHIKAKYTTVYQIVRELKVIIEKLDEND